MKVCVDTTVLIDVLKNEFPDVQESFYHAIASREMLAAPPAVVAELMPQFRGDMKLMEAFLKDHKLNIEVLGTEAARLAGARWMEYLKRKTRARCPNCDQVLPFREHFLSDFYIGGFALAHCDAILTRDRGVYAKYFPDLKRYDGVPGA